MNKDIILLIGMPGCGKSTIGELLAKEINYDFCDMDKYIEAREGKSIKDIFILGEDIFRDIESEACMELNNRKRTVIASGGGIVKRKENIEAFKGKAIIIYIDRPIENINKDINITNRPLLKDGKEKLYNIYKERSHLYNNFCNYKVINYKSINNVLDEIINTIA
ncbi:shikimate kinase [Clostridium sp.]|uniref:shikimate kinase n=1 Tax=Clostridium sp. TaxID=1506 RepID=UPI00261EFA5A|nr:shikimate kinase [Clostridium sp.]